MYSKYLSVAQSGEQNNSFTQREYSTSIFAFKVLPHLHFISDIVFSLTPNGLRYLRVAQATVQL